MATQTARDEPPGNRFTEMWYWLGFSALVGIIPIACIIILTPSIFSKLPDNIPEAFARGELLVVAIALSSELILQHYRGKVEKRGWAFLLCILALVGSAIGFGGSASITDKTEYMWFSWAIFLLAIIAGATSLVEGKT